MSISSQFSKIPKQGKTIFAIVSELAAQYNAIDLSQGIADFEVDTYLIELVHKNMKAGHNQYAPAEGLMALREAIAEKVEKHYGAIYNCEDEITICNGATDAIFTSITAFIREKDEVIVFEPAYDAYTPSIKINGGIPVYVDMKSPKFHFDWEQVQKSITANTRMIILNNPHNPTGTALTAWDIQKLKKIVKGTNILILSDEVYEHLLFDGNEHESLSKYPELKDRTIIINSLGKTFNAPGWRVGFMIAPKSLSTEFRKVHRFSIFTANTPIQYAFAEYLRSFNNYSEITNKYQQKRDTFARLLKGSKYELKPTSGTLFQCINFSQVTTESDFEFVTRLINSYQVATLPLSYLYKNKTDHKILRICFAKHDETLIQAAEKLLIAAQ